MHPQTLWGNYGWNYYKDLAWMCALESEDCRINLQQCQNSQNKTEHYPDGVWNSIKSKVVA